MAPAAETAAWLLAAALRLGAPDAETDRVALIAVETARATRAVPTAPVGYRLFTAAVWASGLEESARFRRDVHSGARTGDRGRSVCLWQIHEGNPIVPPAERAGLVGLDAASTYRCALAGARTTRAALGYCWRRRYFTYWAEATFSAYAGAGCWGWRGRFRRARTMRAILATAPTDAARTAVARVIDRPSASSSSARTVGDRCRTRPNR